MACDASPDVMLRVVRRVTRHLTSHCGWCGSWCTNWRRMSWRASGVRERAFRLGTTGMLQVRCVDLGGSRHRSDAVRVDPQALRPPTLHQQHLHDEVSQGTTTRRCLLKFPFVHTSWHHKIEEPNSKTDGLFCPFFVYKKKIIIWLYLSILASCNGRVLDKNCHSPNSPNSPN